MPMQVDDGVGESTGWASAELKEIEIVLKKMMHKKLRDMVSSKE